MNFYLSRKKALIEGRGNWRGTSHPMAIFVFLWLGYCMFKFSWSKYIWVLFWVMFGQQADGFNLLILLYIKHFDRSLCTRVDGWNPALPKRLDLGNGKINCLPTVPAKSKQPHITIPERKCLLTTGIPSKMAKQFLWFVKDWSALK